MSDFFAFVEFDVSGKPIRIFRTERAAAQSEAWDLGLVKSWPRKRATQAIRRAVFKRDSWMCIHCGADVTWHTGEMHERQARGDIRQLENGEYQGGEISIFNSETRCHNCHTVNADSAHGDRLPQFSRPTL